MTNKEEDWMKGPFGGILVTMTSFGGHGQMTIDDQEFRPKYKQINANKHTIQFTNDLTYYFVWVFDLYAVPKDE